MRRSAYLILGLVCIANMARAATVIGTNALIALPKTAEWRKWVTYEPGDGDTVTINPPIFSWQYVPTVSEMTSTAVREFQFQIAYDSGCTNPVVDLRTKWNFYNLLEPLTEGPVYWRVGYITNLVTGVPYSWSAIRSFTIPGGTTEWDRSFLADTNNIVARGHPRFLFDSNSLVRVRTNLSNTNIARTVNSATNNAWGIIDKTWLLSTQSFTVEFWVKFPSAPATATGLAGQRLDSTNHWELTLNASSQLEMVFTVAGAVVASYTADTPWVPDTDWHHLAFVRNGVNGLIFLDGVSQTLTVTTAFGSAAIGPFVAPLRLANITGFTGLSGQLDEFRLSKAVARYTANFTVATNEFTGSTLNASLVHFNGTNGATSCLEYSGNGGTKNVVFLDGSTITNSAKFGTGSATFDGTGYVEIRDYWMDPQAVGLNSSGTWPPAVDHLYDLCDLALSYQLTGLTNYLLEGRTAQGLSSLARDCIDVGYLYHDNFQGNTIDAIGRAYDWLFDSLSSTQKQNVVDAADLFANYNLNGIGFWSMGVRTGTNWSNNYTDPKTVPYYAASKQGNGHPWANALYALQAVMCTISESTNQNTWDFFDLAVNYMIARTYPYGGIGEGGYNVGVRYSALGLNRTVPTTMQLQGAFPEMHFDYNPYWKTIADWHMRTIPVGIVEADAPWGDTGWGASIDWTIGGPRFISALANDGAAFQHHWNQMRIKGTTPSSDQTAIVSYSTFTNALTAQDISTNAIVYPVGGWAFGSSLPVNTHAAFTNGCGFVFCARPRGQDTQHDDDTDLSFQLWAYGSVITDCGGGMTSYAKTPIAHNTLLVNGLGGAQPVYQWTNVYSRIKGFLSNTDFIYVLADATQAYPISSFSASGLWLYPSQYLSLHSGGPLIGLKRVNRHLLFIRGKYWVIYDDFAAANAWTYCWLYHVYENTVTDLTSSPPGFTYTSNTQKLTGYNTNAPNVTNIVMQMQSGSAITDLTGINVRSNPITGENYYNQGDMAHIRAHAFWVTNSVASTNFHFMTVIYPVKPGDAAPTITKVDDLTVSVVNGGDTDVISFDTNSVSATLIVDLVALGGEAPEPPPTPAPTPLFSAIPISGTVPLDVAFTDESTGSPTSWAWDFDGDSIVDSYLQNPSFTYTNSGSYTVTLTAGNAGGSKVLTKTDYILAVDNPLIPAANFEADVVSGLVPLTVQFTDESIAATSWAWDFENNGSVDSTAQNPTHIYTIPGDYSVKLSINSGASELTKTNYISASNPFVPPTNMVISVGPVTVKQISGR